VGVAVVVEGLDVPASYPQHQESSNHSHDCDNGQKDQPDFPEFSEDWKNAKPSIRIAGSHHRHVGQRHFSFARLFHFRSCLEKRRRSFSQNLDRQFDEECDQVFDSRERLTHRGVSSK
jgi:hypothetical protein